MILKDTAQQEKKYWRFGGYGFVALLFLGFVYIVLRVVLPLASPSLKGKIVCDAETVQGSYFISSGATFANGFTQSNDYAFTGQYCSKVDSNAQRGFSYKMRYPKAGERYKVSVWRFKKNLEGGVLAVSAPSKKDFYRSESIAVERQEGWERLEITFNVPPQSNFEYIEIYVLSNNGQTVYFDDLILERINPNPATTQKYTPPSINLEIPTLWLDKMKQKRDKALSNGLLKEESEGDEAWVKGRILDQTAVIPVELKTKGDWLDQVRSGKWGLRLKTEDAYAWNEMQSFSLETPASRNFLREWIFLKFLQQEGIVVPNYDFVEVKINNKPAGIYAFESYFDDFMLENNQRLPGPILKFSDESYWQNLHRQAQNYNDENGNRQFINGFQVAPVEPYFPNQIQQAPERLRQFDIAKTLLEQYKYNQKPTEAIFDVELLAKFYAIMDVMQAYHGVLWHNLRFYYNPATSKLEPVGFDGYGAKIKKWNEKPFIGYNFPNTNPKDLNPLNQRLFQDPVFLEKYLGYLYRYTDHRFISNFILNLEFEFRQREIFIQKDFETYSFDEFEIIDNARQIRSYLVPFDNLSIQASTAGLENGALRIEVGNFHPVPLEVVGFGKTATELRDTLTEPQLLKVHNWENPPQTLTFQASRDVVYVFYRLPQTDSLFASSISPWRVSRRITPEQALFQNTSLESNPVFDKNDRVLVFKKGNHTVSKTIAIPSGYQVIFEPGTTLNFVSGAGFVSKSAVFMAGSAADPVVIQSSDNSANGFSILQTETDSRLQHVIFKNLKSLNEDGWRLNGSVSFYEANVTFDNCQFHDLKGFDGLLVARNRFEINNCLFYENRGNALEATFSKGIISSSNFQKTKQNAIDLMDCEVEIEMTTLAQSGEKALSVGNKSKVKVKNLTIEKATIGVVAKDLAVVEIKLIRLKDCQEGFAAYQNKAQLGGGQISVQKYKVSNVKYLHLIEAGSELKLGNKVITGS